MRELSLTGATTLTRFNVVDGTGAIVLDNLLCRNTESRLTDCPHNGLGVHNCFHFDDAGVRCLPAITSKQEYVINLEYFVAKLFLCVIFLCEI